MVQSHGHQLSKADPESYMARVGMRWRDFEEEMSVLDDERGELTRVLGDDPANDWS